MNAEYGRHMAKPGSVLVSPGAAGGTAAALATQTLGRSKMLSSKPYEVRLTYFYFQTQKQYSLTDENYHTIVFTY